MSCLHNLAAQAPRPRMVDSSIDDDPMQPGAEWPAPVEAIQGADRGKKCLLRDVLGSLRIANDQISSSMRVSPMASKECLESFFRTPLNGPNQLCLATPVFSPIILLSETEGKPKHATLIGSESGAFYASEDHRLNLEQPIPRIAQTWS